MRALNLETLETRPLYTPPEGFNASCGLVGADGQYIYGVLMEDLSSRIYADLTASYIGMREIFEAKPDCRVFRVNVDTGEAETLLAGELLDRPCQSFSHPAQSRLPSVMRATGKWWIIGSGFSTPKRGLL